jgi:hypothetical protein
MTSITFSLVSLLLYSIVGHVKIPAGPAQRVGKIVEASKDLSDKRIS